MQVVDFFGGDQPCRGRQQNQQLIDFDFFYATGNSHIDRASFTACLQVWFASIISWKAGAKQTSDFLTRDCADGL
jgi:hypothetical protein